MRYKSKNLPIFHKKCYHLPSNLVKFYHSDITGGQRKLPFPKRSLRSSYWPRTLLWYQKDRYQNMHKAMNQDNPDQPLAL